MKIGRLSRKWMYIVSFIACIAVVNVGSLIVSNADEINIEVEYRTYTNESGWQDKASQGGDCSTNSTEAITKVRMMINSESEQTTETGTIKYSVYTSEGNWSEEVESGSKASGGDKPIKAIKVTLTDTLATKYDIEYRACNSNNEWLTWGKNGDVVGNIDGDGYLVAIQAKIVEKQVVTDTSQNTGSTSQDTGNTSPGDGITVMPESGILIQTNTGGTTTEETGTTDTSSSSSGSEAMEAFYNKVVSQIGQSRNSSGNTVYGEWWADRVGESAFKDAAWCAMFLSWCANEAGIAEKTVGYYAACSHWQEFYTGNGRWSAREGYTPKKGDLIFFDYTGDGKANHNGIVESVSDSKVIAIEGNVNDKVDRVEYAINDTTILGYGKPDYDNNAANIEADKKEKEEQEATGSSATGQAQKIIEIAESQIGTKESSSGWTKYGEWYENNIDGSWNFSNAHWCAMFVTWCANQAGVSRDVIKPYAACSVGVSNFKAQGVWHSRSSGYTPKTGDVIFFETYSHTGLVEKVEGGYVHTIEGNTSNMCKRRQHAINSYTIKGYGSPKYN